ncbi:MAG: hypothetical protein AAFY56_23515, partial [Pseudomonadota bacterium]
MSEETKFETEFKPLTWEKIRPFLVVAVAAVVIVFALYVLVFPDGLSDKQEHWGQFGDYVGGLLNPVFGFLSFVALLLALVLQSKELHASTIQLEASADALRDQHEVLTRQGFENTYFQMLRRVDEILADMEFGGADGKRALAQTYRLLADRLRNA